MPSTDPDVRRMGLGLQKLLPSHADDNDDAIPRARISSDASVEPVMTTTSESQPEAPSARRGLAILLSDHHHRLEATYRALLGCAYAEDTRALTLSWSEVEAELLDHMAAEEAVILPSYELHAPDDAHRIREEHARIRTLLMPIGVEVELHKIRLARLRQFVAAIEAHAASEDARMYPWAAQHVALVSQRMLYARISHGLERA